MAARAHATTTSENIYPNKLKATLNTESEIKRHSLIYVRILLMFNNVNDYTNRSFWTKTKGFTEGTQPWTDLPTMTRIREGSESSDA